MTPATTAPTPPVLAPLILGHSHLAALQMAHARRLDAGGGHAAALAPAFLYIGRAKDTPPQAAPPPGELPPAALAALAGFAGQAVVSCIGGNDHAVFGLLNHPRPFDFVLAGAPDLPLAAGAEILPARLVRATLRARMGVSVQLLTALRHRVPGALIHLEPPPPVPSADHIRAHPGVFAGKMAEHGIAPASLRYKLWRLHSAILSDLCRDLGVTLLPVPADTQDADGMLAADAWNPDPTHANAWYGARVLRDLAAHLTRAQGERDRGHTL